VTHPNRMSIKRNKLVCGVGINDVDRPVYTKDLDGKYKICPFYKVWKSMLVRCYDENFHHKLTYEDCYVVEAWLRLSNFENWMKNQDWEGKELDKDILKPGNKQYGPETCVFITHDLNSFLIDSAAARGDYPTGVHLHKMTGRLQAACNNPFKGSGRKGSYLGLYDSVEEASNAWKQKKHEYA